MTWREQLQTVKIGAREYIGGSFRGAPFFVESSDRSGGRRVEIHEYPAQDQPFAEDLGRKARGFSVVGYVVGSGYLAARDALIDALESSDGPGELVHPFHGKRTVVCSEFSVSESRDEGGIARFSMTFTETLESAPFPSFSVDAVASLNITTDALLIALQAGFVAQYDPTTVIGSFLSPMADLLSGFARGMDRPGSSMLREAQALADFRYRLNNAINRSAEYVRDAAGLFDAISGILAVAFAPPTVPRALLEMLGLNDAPWATLPQTAPLSQSRIQQATLHEVLFAAQRRATIVRVAELAAEAEWPIFSDARTVRDELLRRIDAEMDGGMPDDIWQLFQDLRAGILDVLPDPDEQTRDVISLTVSKTEQSLVLCHRLYGDTARELEICSRNALPYPGVIAPGSVLEVVSGV
jgi:prophage DNA circulation protein